MTTSTDPTTPETPENGHNGAQDGLKTPSGQREVLEGQNGAQAGAGGFDAHNSGPSVREAAADDRAYWERKDAGEQP